MEESSASGCISSNSFTADTPSVGDEAEDSESESVLTVVPLTPTFEVENRWKVREELGHPVPRA